MPIWMMGIALIEIVHHIYIDFGVKPCHEHVNSQLGKNNLRLQLEKKNEQLRLNNMQVDKIVSLSSYSQIFSLSYFCKIHLAIQIKVHTILTTTCQNLSYLFFFISKLEIAGSLDNLWEKLHFWPSSWYWHSLLSSPAKSPKCILAGCIVKKTSSVFNNKWTSWGRAVIFVV